MLSEKLKKYLVETGLYDTTEDCNVAQTANLPKVLQAFSKSIQLEYYRKYGFDIIEDEITNYSHPNESMKVLNGHRAIAKEYTKTKFSHLSYLHYELSKSK